MSSDFFKRAPHIIYADRNSSQKKHIDLGRFEPHICTSLVKLLGGPLPSHGIFAGPGVATMLLSLLWDKDIKVDRIDLYSDCLD